MRKLIVIPSFAQFLCPVSGRAMILNLGSGPIAYTSWSVILCTAFQCLNSKSCRELSVHLPTTAICWFLPSRPLYQVAYFSFTICSFTRCLHLEENRPSSIWQLYSSCHTFLFFFNLKGYVQQKQKTNNKNKTLIQVQGSGRTFPKGCLLLILCFHLGFPAKASFKLAWLLWLSLNYYSNLILI